MKQSDKALQLQLPHIYFTFSLLIQHLRRHLLTLHYYGVIIYNITPAEVCLRDLAWDYPGV